MMPERPRAEIAHRASGCQNFAGRSGGAGISGDSTADRRRRLLFVTTNQFGYHIDSYEYARNLARDYDVTFLSWDHGLPRIEAPGVRARYASRAGSLLTRNIRFRREVNEAIREGYDHVFIVYFVGASLTHLAGLRRRVICDVRTAKVGVNALRRHASNTFMRLELATFRNRTILSDCLAGKLLLTNYTLLPLGGLRVPFGSKDLSSFRLLYLGTLTGRRIDETVDGFARFYARYGDRVECTYDIVGTGEAREVEKLQDAIAHHGLKRVVTLHGYVPHDRAVGLIERCNIGISYVPIEAFFECQPPTKTYEYLLGGMVVVATGTRENARVVDEANGVLIRDNPAAVASGLETIYRRRGSYDLRAIQDSMHRWEWTQIVDEHLRPFLQRLDQDRSPAMLAAGR